MRKNPGSELTVDPVKRITQEMIVQNNKKKLALWTCGLGNLVHTAIVSEAFWESMEDKISNPMDQ